MVEKTYACIYCLQIKLQSLFDKEHVIPKAFNLFGSKTKTLINKVCKECNQRFGDTIDNALSRETLEGVHRFQHQAKNSKEFKVGKHTKNHERVATSSLLKGCKIEPIAAENGVGLNYKPKENYDVAFKKENVSEDYDRYYMNQLPDAETLKQKYPNCLTEGIKILNTDKKEDIANTLSKIFNTPFILDEETHEGDCQVKTIYTKEVFRAIAKIAFNYLAYFNSTSLVTQECFDPIRNFIIKGTGEWHQFMQIEKEPIVPDNNGMAADVHLVTVHTSEKSIFSSVSLHNMQHYKICLVQYYKGKPLNVGYGHCFDPYGHKVHELGKSSLILTKMFPSSIQIVKPFIWIPG